MILSRFFDHEENQKLRSLAFSLVTEPWVIQSLLRGQALGSVGAHQPLYELTSLRAQCLIRGALSHELRALDTLIQFLHPM